MPTRKTGSLREFGATLLKRGYTDLIPLRNGTKIPTMSEWQRFQMDPEKLDSLLANGQASADVGLINGRFPTVDADIYDRDVSKALYTAIKAMVPGPMLTRIGLPPKFGIVFRSDEPFKKVVSRTFISGDGRRNVVDIRGVGNQIKLFGIHPDTQRPYQWVHGKGPDSVPASQLPVMTPELAAEIIDTFEGLVPDGWRVETSVRGAAPAVDAADDTERFLLTHSAPQGVSLEQITADLDELFILNDDYVTTRDLWIAVGQSVHHETGGSAEGWAVWDTWSQNGSNYAGEHDTQTVWRSFRSEGNGSMPRTYRSVQAWLVEEREKAAAGSVDQYLDAIRASESTEQLRSEVCPEIQATAGMPDLVRERLAAAVQARVKDLDGFRPGIATARALVKAPKLQGGCTDVSFAEPWVLVCRGGGIFRHRVTGTELSPQGFDLVHAKIISDQYGVGDDVTPPTASHLACVVADIDQVDDVMYLPGKDPLFTFEGKRYLNLYQPSSVPTIPAEQTDASRAAVSRVARHFGHLFNDDWERSVVLDYLSHIVQQPEARPTWAVLIQGGEGAGKSTISTLMAAVLGARNVKELPGSGVDTTFNDWAAGAQLTCIEEVRFVGAGRYAVLNNLKPMITNAIVSLHRKGKDRLNVVNTTGFLLYTNYTDALPITETDRRYFVASTAMQGGEAEQFLTDHPNYYHDLYADIGAHPGAIRQWFLDRKIGSYFHPKGHAPGSASKSLMISTSRSDTESDLDELLADGLPGCNPLILSSRIALELLKANSDFDEKSRDDTWNITRLGYLLSGAGFHKIGRYRGLDAQRHWVWTKNRAWFRQQGRSVRELLTIKECDLIGSDDTT